MFDSMAIAERAGVLTVRRIPIAPPDEPRPSRLAELLEMAPSAETLAEIDEYDASELDESDRVIRLQLWDRIASWVAARQQQAIVDLTGPVPTDREGEDWAVVDVAAALRLSPVSAERRVDAARQLTGRLAATGQALADGRITFWYALSLVGAVAELDDAAALRVENTALDGAETLSIARFRARLRRAVIAAAPKTADERHAAARAERRVVLDPQPDGMAWLSAFLTAPEAIAAYNALNAAVGAPAEALYGTRPADVQPVDARRADAFVAALLGTATADGAAPSLPVQLNLTMDAATALRLADSPAHLDGYGPLPPELARRLAGDAEWRRLVTDPVTGHLLDYGRSTYRPPRALARYIKARDVTCRFPGCNRRAQRCDLDHAQAWDREGSTCSANLGALCRYHHRAKTHGGWDIESRPDGSARWRSPRGPTYEQPAIDHNPEHTQRLAETAARRP